MNQRAIDTNPLPTAAEVCANLDLQREAKLLLRDDMKVSEFVTALIEQKKYVDAIHFLAHALPVREGIWWGCLCMQHALGDNLSPNDRTAATAALQWVMRPSEENRAAAKGASEAAPPPSIAGALAAAAFRPNLPEAPFAASTAIALAVQLACAKAEAREISRAQRSYAKLGLEAAEDLRF